MPPLIVFALEDQHSEVLFPQAGVKLLVPDLARSKMLQDWRNNDRSDWDQNLGPSLIMTHISSRDYAV